MDHNWPIWSHISNISSRIITSHKTRTQWYSNFIAKSYPKIHYKAHLHFYLDVLVWQCKVFTVRDSGLHGFHLRGSLKIPESLVDHVLRTTHWFQQQHFWNEREWPRYLLSRVNAWLMRIHLQGHLYDQEDYLGWCETDTLMRNILLKKESWQCIEELSSCSMCCQY